MSTAERVSAYVTALVAVFALSMVAGRVISPDAVRTPTPSHVQDGGQHP